MNEFLNMQEARIYATPESSILAGNEVPAYADIAFSPADIAFFAGCASRKDLQQR
jgi:hypothetical protein